MQWLLSNQTPHHYTGIHMATECDGNQQTGWKVYLRRRKGYSSAKSDLIVGERNCAFDGCNALEFRTSGYCLRHKDSQPGLTPVKAIPVSDTRVATAYNEEEWNEKEEEIMKSPLGWLFGLTVLFYPPILLLAIPIYLLIRANYRDVQKPSSLNTKDKHHQDKHAITLGENSNDTDPPWWVVAEEESDSGSEESCSRCPATGNVIKSPVQDSPDIGKYILLFIVMLVVGYQFYPILTSDPCFGFPGSEPCP